MTFGDWPVANLVLIIIHHLIDSKVLIPLSHFLEVCVCKLEQLVSHVWALRIQFAALCSYWVHVEIGLQLLNLCAPKISWSWWTTSLTFLSYQVEWVKVWFFAIFSLKSKCQSYYLADSCQNLTLSMKKNAIDVNSSKKEISC